MLRPRRTSSIVDPLRLILSRAQRAYGRMDLRDAEAELQAILHRDPTNIAICEALHTIQRRLAVITSRSRMPTVIG